MNPSLPPPLPPSHGPPPRKGFGAWISRPKVLIPSIILLVILLFGGVITAFIFIKSDYTPTASQRACVITAADLASEFGITVTPADETWSSGRYLDGSIEIDYLYEDSSPDLVLLNCTLAVENSTSDAKLSLGGYWEGTKLGTKLGGGAPVTFEEAPHIFSWGDASRFAFLKSGGDRYALIFVARKGKKVFFLQIANCLLEEPSEVEAFLKPYLERFARETF